MDKININLGLADTVAVNTYGEPGNRTFNVTVKSKKGEAVMWLEKELLDGLGRAIGEHLKKISKLPYANPDYQRLVVDTDDPGDFVEVNIRAYNLVLSYKPSRGVFTVSAKFVNEEDEEEESIDNEVNFSLLSSTAKDISEEIRKIVTAGRPRCPICSQPVEIGISHLCTRRNGHITI